MSKAVLRKSGGSLIMVIPRAYAEQNNLSSGSALSLKIEGDRLIGEPSKPRSSLKGILARTPRGKHRVEGWDEMADIGAEA